MDYKKLTVNTWKELYSSGDLISGYQSKWLAIDESSESNLHIFKDENGKYHFAIEDKNIKVGRVDDPNVNGLAINVSQYRIGRGNVKKVIDIQCGFVGFLDEFTEITKEIAKGILEFKEDPAEVVNRVVISWKAFWSTKNKLRLSEEEQIGLLCELLVFKELCNINPANAVNSWKGPLGERHDFIFTDWSFEVKGTRGSNCHTINGIDQLKTLAGKSLAFISFLLSVIKTGTSVNLVDLIESIINKSLYGRPDLQVNFNNLLSLAGYTPLYAEEYRKYEVEVIMSSLFVVDLSFPKLTSDNFLTSLSPRVSKIRYDISLDDLKGISFSEISWGNYIY